MPQFRILAVLVVAACASAPAAHAFQNEPTGFRGFAWGTAQDQVIAKLDPVFSRAIDPGMVEYRSRRDLSANGIPLNYNFYQFYKGRFAAGVMETYAAHCGSMLQTLIGRFGQPTDRAGRARYLWNGTTTAIVYICNRRGDFCRVGFESIALLDQRQKDIADSARKNGDF
jgi:hypothetical protein